MKATGKGKRNQGNKTGGALQLVKRPASGGERNSGRIRPAQKVMWDLPERG